MLFKNLSHGVVHGVDRAASTRRDEFLDAEDFQQYRRLGGIVSRFRRSKIDLIIDLSPKDWKRLETVISFPCVHGFE